ncbi:MAG: hypothetical protein U1F45_18830 [Burkholderiales bacterium]
MRPNKSFKADAFGAALTPTLGVRNVLAMRTVFVTVLVLIVAAFQLYVTLRLLRFNGYTWAQKLLQLLLIWLIPLAGALIVHSVMAFTLRRPRPDTAFISDRGGNPPGI